MYFLGMTLIDDNRQAATALVLGVLLWALVGTGVDLENFNAAVEGTLEPGSRKVLQKSSGGFHNWGYPRIVGLS